MSKEPISNKGARPLLIEGARPTAEDGARPGQVSNLLAGHFHF